MSKSGRGVLLSEAWDHISAAIAVLKFARNGADALPPPVCNAVAQMLERANSWCSELELNCPYLDVLGSPEFVHRITGAIELAKFGSGNDLGDDNLNSGLPLCCVWLAETALIQCLDYMQTALRAEQQEVAHV